MSYATVDQHAEESAALVLQGITTQPRNETCARNPNPRPNPPPPPHQPPLPPPHLPPTEAAVTTTQLDDHAASASLSPRVRKAAGLLVSAAAAIAIVQTPSMVAKLSAGMAPEGKASTSASLSTTNAAAYSSAVPSGLLLENDHTRRTRRKIGSGEANKPPPRPPAICPPPQGNTTSRPSPRNPFRPNLSPPAPLLPPVKCSEENLEKAVALGSTEAAFLLSGFHLGRMVDEWRRVAKEKGLSRTLPSFEPPFLHDELLVKWHQFTESELRLDAPHLAIVKVIANPIELERLCNRPAPDVETEEAVGFNKGFMTQVGARVFLSPPATLPCYRPLHPSHAVPPPSPPARPSSSAAGCSRW